jgi:hypothetical protein
MHLAVVSQDHGLFKGAIGSSERLPHVEGWNTSRLCVRGRVQFSRGDFVQGHGFFGSNRREVGGTNSSAARSVTIGIGLGSWFVLVQCRVSRWRMDWGFMPNVCNFLKRSDGDVEVLGGKPGWSIPRYLGGIGKCAQSRPVAITLQSPAFPLKTPLPPRVPGEPIGSPVGGSCPKLLQITVRP